MGTGETQQDIGFWKKLIVENRWGGQCLISLYISIISGIIVAIQYDVGEPFYSTATIELIVPYGAFWRALHYYSSQAFFLLLLGHLGAILWSNEYQYSRGAWVRLLSSLPIGLLLLFTGYVLRGDATGEAAGLIAENICLSIPLIGHWVNDLFFDLVDSGVRKVYMHHLIGLVALGAFSLWPHLRRYTANWRNHVLLTLLTLLISILWVAPIEPDRIGLLHIAGPWFFLGLQELLRYLPTFLAGVIVPLIPMTALLLLPTRNPARMKWLAAIGLWLLFYAVLTFMSYLRI